MSEVDEAQVAARAEAQLRQAADLLGVDELLSLCYALGKKPERLRLYLDVLRKRAGSRAQFACCLICFDLARQGDAAAQRDFVFLAATIRALAADEQLVRELVADDPYLSFVWELLLAQLDDMDVRFTGQAQEAPAAEQVAELKLLSDADLADFGIVIDDVALQQEFNEQVERFLGGIAGIPAYDPEAGFRLRHKWDVERVEEFLRELDSVRSLLPQARGFRALTLLFYATHLRSKSLFGRLNARKQEMLREGLSEFIESGDQMAVIVGVLNPLHADDMVWVKVGEVLLDYVHWLAGQGEGAAGSPQDYPAVERLIAREDSRSRTRPHRRRGTRE